LHAVDEPSALQTFAQQGDTVCAAAELANDSINAMTADAPSQETT